MVTLGLALHLGEQSISQDAVHLKIYQAVPSYGSRYILLPSSDAIGRVLQKIHKRQILPGLVCLDSHLLNTKKKFRAYQHHR